MKFLLSFIVASMLLFSCSKDDANTNLFWSKSYGSGEARSVDVLSDSLIIACGQVDGKPFLVGLNNKYEESTLIKPDFQGSFNSIQADGKGLVTAGCRGKDLLLMSHGYDGSLVWDDTIKTGFNTESARLLTINDGLIAIATPDPDSLDDGDSGFMFVKFNKDGHIVSKKKVAITARYVSVSDAVTDNEGNIYLALTYRTPGSRSYSAAAAYSANLNLLWETVLFNNRAFSSACLVIETDLSGKVFAGGRTEISNQSGTLMNSYLVALNKNNGTISGDWPQKRYLELRNQGSAIAKFISTLYFLNRSCYIINEINPSDGTDRGLIRPFNTCISESTDAFAYDFRLISDDKFVIAGSLGGNFFIGIKEIQ